MDINTEINLAWLQEATLQDLKTAMRSPLKLSEVNTLLQTPEGKEIAGEMLGDPDYVPRSKRPVSDEEKEQLAADTAMAEQQALEDQAAALAADTAQREAAAAALIVPPVVEKKKIVIDYQVTADDGTPIGRPTHIEGWSDEEVREKLKNAHTHAVRYAERVKKNRVNSVETNAKQERDLAQTKAAEAEAEAAIQEAAKDPGKLPDAIRKVTKAERESNIAKESTRAAGLVVANAWMADHLEDFQPCDANSKIIGNWLQNNNLGLTYDNLELAFTAIGTQLAKPTSAPVVDVPASPALNAPVPAPAAPAPVPPPIVAPVAPVADPVIPVAPQPVQPVVTTPVIATPAGANNIAPPARRPGVNGSLPPGTLTAVRPTVVSQVPVVTTSAAMQEEIKKMSPQEYRAKLKTQEFVIRLRAAGIPVVGQR